MQIAGLQKLTLLDFPGQVACTVFLPGCQFKCPFCHNAALVTEHAPAQISTEECLGFLKGRQGILDGVCITGGEPTLQPNLADFIRQIKALGFSVKLDTNGYRPDVLKALASEKLVDYVAMDIKNAKARYAETCGLLDLDIEKIEESVAFLKTGAVPFEFRTTVVKEFHGAEDILSLAEWIQGDIPYFLQGFVDSGALIGQNLHALSQEEMQVLKELAKPYLPQVELRGV